MAARHNLPEAFSLNLMMQICHAVQNYPALETLEIDRVLTKDTGNYSHSSQGTDPMVRACQIYELSRRNCPVEEQKKKKLKLITVTGLPRDL